MKKISPIILAFITAITLVACSSTPVDPNVAAERNLLKQTTKVSEITSTKEGKQYIDSTRYLARNLMGTDDRKELAKIILKESPDWVIAEPLAGFAAASVLTDNPFSHEGSLTAVTVTAALEFATYIFDGSKDAVATLWLPKTVNGVTIKSASQAKEIGLELTKDALTKAFDKRGYDIRFAGTLNDGINKVYTGELRADYQNTSTPSQPKYIMAMATVFDYIEIEENDPVEQLALGFTPAYRSTEAGHQITILGGHRLDDNGKIVMDPLDEGTEVVSPNQNLWATALGRDLFRDISKDLPWVQGYDQFNKRFVVRNGDVFSFFSTSPTGFLNKRIDG